MPETNLFRLFSDRLNTLGTRYIVTGSVAAMAYGEPRLTQDVDIVLDLDPVSAQKLCDLFPIEDFFCPPVEVVRIEASRRQRGHLLGVSTDLLLRILGTLGYRATITPTKSKPVA